MAKKFACLPLIRHCSAPVHTKDHYINGTYFFGPCQVGLVVSVAASHTVGHEFTSRPGHTNDNHKNVTNWLPPRHVLR